MINSFSAQHPWLTRKIKKEFWKLINILGITSYTFKLPNSELLFSVNPKDASVGKLIFLNSYEVETLEFASKYIIKSDQVFDVGANIGYFTLKFSSLVGDNGEVHSFEPSQREFLHLCRNLMNNKISNVFSNQVALSNKNSYSRINILDEDRYGAYNSINKITHRKVNEAKVHTETTRTLKIDTYLDLFPNIRPTLIKIDVEGHEKQVLEGMQRLLTEPNSPCLIIEVCESTHQDEKFDTQDLLDYIKKFDYKLYSPNNEGNLKPFLLGNSLNCIALKNNHFQRLNERKIEIYSK